MTATKRNPTPSVPQFDDNARSIWARQYPLTEGEEIIEGFTRVASIARKPETRDTILALMSQKKFCPGGRILAGAGSSHRQTNNCFRAGTLVHTEQGILPIETLEGRTVGVLTEDGQFRQADFKSYGEQQLVEVIFSNGQSVFATPGHDWIVKTKTGKKIVKTTDLLGARVPIQDTPRSFWNLDHLETGIRHGIMYGDGTVYSPNFGRIELYGEKRELSRFFRDFAVTEHEGFTRISGVPAIGKQLPPQDASTPYWRGFLAGLIATDGHVCGRQGSVSFSSADIEAIRAIQQGLRKAGVLVTGVSQFRDRNPFTGEPSAAYNVRLARSTISSLDILRDPHLKHFCAKPSKREQSLEVVGVRHTDLTETVYCCEEPVTHTMTIEGGIVTRQCFAYASDSGEYASLEDVQSLALKFALTTKVGGGNGANLDAFRTKNLAEKPASTPITAYLSPEHPDHASFYDWRYRDITLSKGTEWVSPPRRALELADDRSGVIVHVPDDMKGIIEAGFEMIRLHNAGKPLTLVFDAMRQEGSEIRGSGGTASGPSSFAIEIFDNFLHWARLGGPTAGPVAFLRYVAAPILRVVRQGGVRRGAGMATLSIEHEDWRDFLNCKDLDREASEGDISTFNISFLIPEEWAVDAKKLWTESGYRMAEIAKHAWKTGEPGLIFVDTLNRNSVLNELGYVIKTTNPCGEVPLLPGEPCDLGAINLAAYVVNGEFQWGDFRDDLPACFDFLDDNLDYCVYPVPDATRMSARNRRMGLGVMGLADALILMGLPYSSEEARDFAYAIKGAMGQEGLLWSCEAALEKGEPAWSVEARERGVTTAPQRNVAMLTVAPTGTTSMLMGVSSGIEPVYSPFIHRKVGDSYLKFVHPLFMEALSQYPPVDGMDRWEAHDGPTRDMKRVWDTEKVIQALDDAHGSVQGLDWVPQEMQRVFVFAHDIAPLDHVRMQGAVQRGMDVWGIGNSVSKTINLPNSASVNDVLDAYCAAHELGCKGITVYRDGSRSYQVLSTSSKKAEKSEGEQAMIDEFDAQCASGACERPEL